MHDPWTLYWQSDRLDSADAIESADDASALGAFWTELAAGLNVGATLLDLATGNGTVPLAVLTANADLQVTGVDKADIDPLRFLSAPGALESVDFRGGIDICSLPFDDGTFDAVTSQFGIEYAPLDSALAEAVRVLAGGGELRLLMHHSDSEIVAPASIRRREMEALLVEDGVLQKLKAFVSGELSEEELEAAGQAYIASDQIRSKGISGQIFLGVETVIAMLRRGERRSGVELCATMLLRLGADNERLRMLQEAALGKSDFEDIVARLETAGVKAITADALHVNAGSDDEFIIGWQYCGRKN